MLVSPLHPQLPQQPKGHVHWGQLYGSSKSLALANLACSSQAPILLMVSDMAEANRLYDELCFFKTETCEILLFPDWETLPYDTFSPHEDIISSRLTVLSRLPHLTQGILIIPMTTLMHPLMPREYLQTHSLVLQQGQQLDLTAMRQTLMAAGYRSVEQVMQHGEFALRGAIIDLYPMGSELPYRIDLLADEIDSIRTFDPETQRSVEKLTAINLLPAKEFPLTEESITRFRQAWGEQFNGRPMDCPIYEDISQGLSSNGIEYYLPLFYQETASLFDYLPKNSIIVHNEGVYQAAEKFWLEVRQRYAQYSHDVTRPLLPPQRLFISIDKVFALCKQYLQISLHTKTLETGMANTNFTTAQLPNVAIDTQSQSKMPLKKLKGLLGQTVQRVLFCAETAGRREALLELLATLELHPKILPDWQTFLQGNEMVAIVVGRLDSGLSIADPSLLMITESQLYGERVMQRRLRKRRKFDEDNFIRSLMELQPGVPVVHIDHGVGRYLGLNTIKTGDITTEFATIEYAQGSKLHVPVANLHLLSRYSAGDVDHAPLHYLGTQQWHKAKQKAAQRARDVAAELLDLYARRTAKQGQSCEPVDEHYQAFAAAFPFEETPDQARAIEAVLADMGESKPMDRLVCGDVGFGKTEVAMRAAFLAVQNHYQVAILVPTTLLAEQHYQNFKDRFANWAVSIELLSRFRTQKQQQQVVEHLQQAKIDIVIGTHKLLQENIKFANLGLLVIDEEHRFGVRQKERIKALRTDVNILTLTATPIPRTLNMSLAQIRELSLIATPPARRLSIKTFLQRRNPQIIREAILREISRGGQVYFLHNKVTTIEQTARELGELIPEAKIGIGHGQMHARELEHIMADFYHQRFNVLVCTTIIENGIDIPSANTIIMDRADKLGLAQLHQLRGRVGRSHHQAYAYLLIPDAKLITRDAQKRLDAIVATEDLGAGFTLATHDMEIRGAGELLGEEQSGQIATVGFSLYMEFLDRAVKALKSGEQTDFTKPLIQHTEIDLQLSTLIPDTYIYDVHNRLLLYKRIAGAADKIALKDLQVEMIDRFGLLPEETKNLMQLTELKLQVEQFGIVKIQASEQGGVIEFDEQPKIDPMKIIQLIQKKPRIYKLQGSQKLTFNLKSANARQRFAVIEQVLQAIA